MLAAVVLACAQSEHAVFLIVGVLITNLLGMMVAIFVTTIWGLPNDGSLQKFADPEASSQTDVSSENENSDESVLGT